MESNGLSNFLLYDAVGTLVEVQSVQHENICAENYYEGVLQGLYFGGTCRAPVEVVVEYGAV